MSDKPEPPPPATPHVTTEEITRKLEDFIRNSLGGQVLFTRVEAGKPPSAKDAEPPATEPEPDEDDELEHVLQFKLKPADIKAHLDRYVIRQDEAKKVLATAVCDHYNHAKIMRELQRQDRAHGVELAKQNVLIAGPTGVGKTYLVKHIAELIGVPFVKADATKFSETGYVGADVDDLVRDLVAKANGNITLAEHGIIYLDEVDKIATRGDRMGRDVSGRGVQTTLLKLMEETEVPLHAQNDFRSQMRMMFEMRKGRAAHRDVISTRNILFIVSGAFAGIEKLIEKREAKATIGFGAAMTARPAPESLMRFARTQDFIDYGFEAEFVGRLPVRVVCDALSADDLLQVMKCSAGSLIRQYEREFAAYGVRATFEESAMRVIAERAAEERTGARGLVTAWERVLRDFKFELPSLGLPTLTIDEALVLRPQEALAHCRDEAARWSAKVGQSEAQAFAEAFQHEHGLELAFEAPALRALVARAQREGSDVSTLCRRLFRDYPFGLQLVTNNQGRRRFSLPAEAVADADHYLSDLVEASYRANRAEGSMPTPNPQ